MRTQEEILQRIELRKPNDPLGFEVPIYLTFLDYENAKPHLKPETEESDWKVQGDLSEIRQEMIDYMPFAWEKANNCRGLSAARSIQHYQAWLWLIGNEELSNSIADYKYYGKPQLIQICEYLELDHKQWDDGVRTH